MYMYVCMYVYIYIHIERERERDISRHVHIYVFMCMCCMCTYNIYTSTHLYTWVGHIHIYEPNTSAKIEVRPISPRRSSLLRFVLTQAFWEIPYGHEHSDP